MPTLMTTNIYTVHVPFKTILLPLTIQDGKTMTYEIKVQLTALF